MSQVLHVRLRARGLPAMLLAALAVAAQPPASQAQGQGIRVEERVDPTLQPLTAAERRQVATVLQNDSQVRTRLAGSRRVRTVLVERREEDKDVRTGQRRTGQRRADVVLYNYDTNETISAVVILAPGPQRVADLAVIRGQPRGLSAEEVQEAQQLALAHPAVQAALQAAGLAGRESELIITHMHVQAAAPDRCSTHRCVALSFNTRDAVLGIEPVVDLTTGDVAVQ